MPTHSPTFADGLEIFTEMHFFYNSNMSKNKLMYHSAIQPKKDSNALVERQTCTKTCPEINTVPLCLIYVILML